MKIPDKARYYYVAYRSSEFIIEENITCFPVSPYEIIKRHKWALTTYSTLAKEMCCDIDDISSAFMTDEAYTILMVKIIPLLTTTQKELTGFGLH